MNSFRATVFDPVLVIGQMLCLQSLYYSIETCLMFGLSFNNYRPSLDHIFSLQTIRSMTVIQLLSVAGSAVAMPLIVGRAKQCLDFAFTLHFVHAIFSCVYNKALPLQLTWWLLQVIGVFVCTVIGEYLCMRQETLDIPLTFNPSKIIEA